MSLRRMKQGIVEELKNEVRKIVEEAIKTDDGYLPFADDEEGIDALVDYLKKNYKEGKDFELWIERGNTYPTGIDINNTKILKDKMFEELYEAVEVW